MVDGYENSRGDRDGLAVIARNWVLGSAAAASGDTSMLSHEVIEHVT